MTAYLEDEHERTIRHKAEVAALHEEIDRLLAALKVEQQRASLADELREKVKRLTLALDEALAMARARNAVRQLEEAAEL